MTGAVLALAAPDREDEGLAEYGHVLEGVRLKGPAARLAAALDPAFLAEAGWDPRRRVFDLPAGHGLLGGRLPGQASHPTARGVLQLFQPAGRSGS